MKTLVVTTILLLIAVSAVAATPDGAAIYKAKCASCHGADGTGQTAMGKAMKLRDLGSADVQKLSDADLTTVTADGKGKMPAYKGKLSAEEIKALVTFMRTFKK
jgi:mono/diheme cytochrome c family protein